MCGICTLPINRNLNKLDGDKVGEAVIVKVEVTETTVFVVVRVVTVAVAVAVKEARVVSGATIM
jgi:hypothetical protein